MKTATRHDKNKGQKRRHVPQRTCVGCRTVQPKREMIRVVRTPEGSIEVDPTGKHAGRGAYLCQKKDCWEQAIKRHSLDRALQVMLNESETAALLEYTQHLPAQEEPTPDVKVDGSHHAPGCG